MRCPSCGKELQSAPASLPESPLFYYCMAELKHWKPDELVQDTARRLVVQGSLPV